MRLRKARNSHVFIALLAVLWAALPFFVPEARAYDFSTDHIIMEDLDTGFTCPGQDCQYILDNTRYDKIEICPGPGFTRRIMPCVKETILAATNSFLVPFSGYLADFITLTLVLAMALLGMLWVTNRASAAHRDTLVTLAKIGGVSMFTANFGGMFGVLLDAMDELQGLVTHYVILVYSNRFGCPDYTDPPALMVWNAVDCALNLLIGGIYDPKHLTMGIIGFFVACVLSTPLGFVIGMMGFYFIVQVIMAMIRALYIYISAYIGVALMVIISPLFIPCILFRATRSYFSRWLKNLGSFIVQPMIMFAYLAVVLAAFEVVVYSGPYSLYYRLIGSAVDDDNFFVPWEAGGQNGVGGWLFDHGAYVTKDMDGKAINIDAKSLSESDFMPDGVKLTGTTGDIASKNMGAFFDMAKQKQDGLFSVFGIGEGGKSDLRFFKVAMPAVTVDWKWLAVQSGYVFVDEDGFAWGDDTMYVVEVLLSMLMALLVGYILLQLLDFLPFIGGAMAMGSGMVDEKTLGLSKLGIGRMAPPTDDFMKRFKMPWQQGHK